MRDAAASALVEEGRSGVVCPARMRDAVRSADRTHLLLRASPARAHPRVKRTPSPGRSWPARGRSAVTTTAMTG